MQLYDTARRAVVAFEPNDHVLMYTCGITPYDATHLGHAATFVAYDVLQRRLIDMGQTVRCVRNVTDVDDPSSPRRENSVSTTSTSPPARPRVSTTTWTRSACCPWSEPRATSAIADIRGFIGMVLDRGHAYEAGGSVYFDVSTYDRVVRFAESLHRDEMLALRQAQRGGNVDDPNKRDPLDFVLWHPSAADEPSWDSLWGPGRPGWHIECSALALRELGTTIDLHGGGADLIFPHHECEARPVRGRHRRAVRAPLDAPGDGPHGRREDVEVARQPRLRGSAARNLGSPSHPSGDHRTPLPGRVGVGRRVDAEVRARLDDDLDTPGAIAAIDAAAAAGAGVGEAATLLGVDLD
jgi:L-cysteine:1D-myo-inositol 2-amino-2-deoxy-alpha-D-glucopyranoside ligase